MTGAAVDSDDSFAQAGLHRDALDRLGEAIRADVANGLHFGAVVLVARHGEIGLHEAIGSVQGDESDPLRTGDRFLAMSVTKAYTAAAILRLIDRGKLSFDTRVATVIPEFGQRGKQRVTIYHLLTHTSGLAYGFTLPPELIPLGGSDLSRAVEAVVPLPLAARPGSRVSYSPWEGFAILAEVLRRLDSSGRSFRQILREDVFVPLGMTDTTIGAPVGEERRIPIKVVSGGGAAQPAAEIEAINDQGEECEIPGASGYTTAFDTFRFAEMIRRRGLAFDGSQFLSPTMVDFAYRIHTGEMRNEFWDFNLEAADLPDFPANLTLGGGYGRGPGLSHITPAGYTASELSFAAVGGGTTMFMVDPARDLSFVFLSSGMVEGLAHFDRLRRLSDLALASVEN